MLKPDYEQDNLKLFNADCMEVMKQYEDNYFDLAVVDPPYGIGIMKQFKSAGFLETRSMFKQTNGIGGSEWDSCIPNEEYFIELKRVSKNQIIWGGNYFLDYLNNTKCFLVWDKMNGTNNMADCELAWTSLDKGVRKFSMHHFSKCYGNKIHICQKPVLLYDWIYKLFSEPSQKILDTHLGSGSNAISAHYAKMEEFVGCELDEDYFNASVKRIYKETRQQELF